MSPSETIAGFVAGVDAKSLPDEVVTATRRIILDALACAVAGFYLAEDIVRPIRAYALDVGGPGSSTLLVGGEQVSAPTAALANGTTVHTIDYDDTHMGSIAHFGASVVPAALAAVESRQGTGSDLLAAVAAGYEVGGKVGRCLMPGHYERWHPTATVGGVAAAAAAGRALTIEPAGIDGAIGFAADDAGGGRYCLKEGDFTKSLHAGTAACKGVRGALLSRTGARGPRGHLEHPAGFLMTFAGPEAVERLGDEVKGLGSRWEVLEVDFKKYPSVLSSHAVIEAVGTIVHHNGIAWPQIEAIHVVHPYYAPGHCANYHPGSVMAARLSLPYCAAVAAMDGDVGLEQFSAERVADGDTARLMQRVSLEADPVLNERFPSAPAARVSVTTAEEQYEIEIGVPKGAHSRPLTWEEHREKIVDLLGIGLPAASVENVVALVEELEALPSIGPLVQALTDEGRPHPHRVRNGRSRVVGQDEG